MTACVYRATNTVNGKTYVGATAQRPRARWLAHLREARNGGRRTFQRAIRKYGEAAFKFEVVALLPTYEEAMLCERIVIATEMPAYNQTAGGEGCLGFKRSAASVAKTRAAHLGKPVSEETKAKLRAANLGKRQSPELVEKRVAPLRGKKRPAAVIAAIQASRAGFKHSDETKELISELNRKRKGERRSPEARARMSVAQRAIAAARKAACG